jgi:hypothetical protein
MCHEVLHDILAVVDPRDLAALSQSCRLLHSFIDRNRILWKDVYLHNCDDPRRETDREEPNWEERVKQLVQWESILKSPEQNVSDEIVEFVCGFAVELVEHAPPYSASRNIPLLTRYFHLAGENAAKFVLSSNVFELAKKRPQLRRPETSQAVAHLHCLYGTVRDELVPTVRGENVTRPYEVARSYIYDMRTYTPFTKWGPFLPDGSMLVDWEKVESIMMVTALNYVSNGIDAPNSGIWGTPFDGVTRGSYVSQDDRAYPFSESDTKSSEPDSEAYESDGEAYDDSYPSPRLIAQPDLALEAQDPYGVTGTWRRVICHLDYREFYQFNFMQHNLPAYIARPAIAAPEAIRLIVVKIQVTKITNPCKEDGDALPVVHFKGISRSLYMQWDPSHSSEFKGSSKYPKNVSLLAHG